MLSIDTKEKFIDMAKLAYPKANDTILKFISDFVFHSDSKSTINLFSQGYCYHFAQILNVMFDGGEICWVAPYSHIIWLKDNIPYDINGVYNGESTKFIPISFLGHCLEDFKHTPDIYHITSKTDIDNIIYLYDQSQKESIPSWNSYSS